MVGMQPYEFDNNRPAQTMVAAEMMAAPKNVWVICDKATKLLRLPEGPCRVTAVSIKRPSGHTNLHVRLDPPSGQRVSVSLGASDDATVKAAILALCKTAKISAEIAL